MNNDELERGLRHEPPDLPASVPPLTFPRQAHSTRPHSRRIAAGASGSLSTAMGAALVLALTLAVVGIAGWPPADVPSGPVGANSLSHEPSARLESSNSAAAPPTGSPSPSALFRPSVSPQVVTVSLDPTHSLELTIIDESGLLLEARSAAFGEQAPPDPMMSLKGIFAFNPSTVPANEVRLVWVGTICDRSAELRIAPNVTALSITEGPRGSCDAMGVGRGVVLTFDHAIDASLIALRTN